MPRSKLRLLFAGVAVAVAGFLLIAPAIAQVAVVQRNVNLRVAASDSLEPIGPLMPPSDPQALDFTPTVTGLGALISETSQAGEVSCRRSVDGNVLVRYLGHSGWLVDTGAHVLLFDYVSVDPNSGALGGELRIVRPEVLSGRRVVIFVSHSHEDHYAQQLLGWRDILPDLAYVVADVPVSGPGIQVVGPRQNVRVADVEVWTIRSTDEGVGFLVRADGLTVFHAGDHAQWTSDSQQSYRAELEYLAGLRIQVDLAFLPIATGGDCEARPSIQEGAFLAIQLLKPATAVPMHVRCPDRQDLYEKFVEAARARGLSGVRAVLKMGDTFLYRTPSSPPRSPP